MRKLSKVIPMMIVTVILALSTPFIAWYAYGMTNPPKLMKTPSVSKITFTANDMSMQASIRSVEQKARTGNASSSIIQSEGIAPSLGTEYDNLDESLRMAYDQVLSGLLSGAESFPASMDIEDSQTVTKAVLLDHPELFWAKPAWTVHETIDGVILRPDVTMSPKEQTETLRQMEEAADSLTEGASDSEYDIAYTAYRNLSRLCDYDIEAPDSQSAKGALLDHRSVCAGYSRALQYVLQRHGMKCGVVTGSCDGESHMWCIANIDGEWCQIDPTWGDPDKTKDSGAERDVEPLPEYFGMTDEEATASLHTVDAGQVLPSCDSHANSPFYREGRVMGTYDRTLMSEMFWSQVEDDSILIKVEDDDAWDIVLSEQRDKTLFRPELESISISHGGASINYWTRVNENLHVLQMHL